MISPALLEVIASGYRRSTTPPAEETVNSKNITASFTRPADTTTYTAGDVMANSTSAPTILQFTNFASVAGGGGIIKSAQLIDSVAATLKPDVELYLFDTSITMQNDNAAWTPSDSDMTHCLGKIYFPQGAFSVGSGNGIIDMDGLEKQVTCAGGSTTIYGIPVVRNAYLPGNAEQFNFNLQIIQTP